MDQPFRDRVDAGRRLLSNFRHQCREGSLVLATPGGSLLVACEVARALRAELDVVVMRSIDVPLQEEMSLGVIVNSGNIVLQREVIAALKITAGVLQRMASDQLTGLLEEERGYRGDRPPLNVAGRRVVFVDDGLTPAPLLRAVVAALRAAGPTHMTVAIPIAAAQTLRSLWGLVDETVCFGSNVADT